MLLYVGVALVLILALLLFSMAAGHKTLLNPEVEKEFLERLGKLAPGAPAVWGRMSVAQMLRHVAAGTRMALGDLAVPPRKGPLRVFPLKQLIVFVFPMPRSAPTAPELLTKEEPEFETERAAVRELLTSFSKREVKAWPDHPAFGSLDRDQWGVLMWKHIDHHFRQFGV